MTAFQKIFLLSVAIYFGCKGIIVFLLYLATKRIEKKGLEHKRRREQLLRIRRARNMELYQQQYQAAAEKRKRLRTL